MHARRPKPSLHLLGCPSPPFIFAGGRCRGCLAKRAKANRGGVACAPLPAICESRRNFKPEIGGFSPAFPHISRGFLPHPPPILLHFGRKCCRDSGHMRDANSPRRNCEAQPRRRSCCCCCCSWPDLLLQEKRRRRRKTAANQTKKMSRRHPRFLPAVHLPRCKEPSRGGR